MHMGSGVGATGFLSGARTRMLTGPDRLVPTCEAGIWRDERRGLLVVADGGLAMDLFTGPRWSRAAAVHGPGTYPNGGSALFTGLDPPRHIRLRGPVARAFTPRAVQQFQPAVVRRAEDLASALHTTGRTADLLWSFCCPFAFGVHCDFLGIPDCAGLRTPDPAPGVVGLSPLGRIPLLRVFADLRAAQRRGRHSDAEALDVAQPLRGDGIWLAAAQITRTVASLLVRHGELPPGRAGRPPWPSAWPTALPPYGAGPPPLPVRRAATGTSPSATARTTAWAPPCSRSNCTPLSRYWPRPCFDREAPQQICVFCPARSLA
ncbi:hypothetical protein [Streptomyces sp. NPDC048442]|uniref:hypothetical protein n=1 Tax=Streptomyces sp. NPDC048442 TaxID=3154823 RepID=UPI003425778F